MSKAILMTCLAAACLAPQMSAAHAMGTARPVVLLDQTVEGMPGGGRQEIRVMTATFEPAQKTVFHTHRYPVTVHVLDGEFVLDLEGQESARHAAGDTFVEPPGTSMTGYNGSDSAPLKVLIFYVSEPDTPFLDPVK